MAVGIKTQPVARRAVLRGLVAIAAGGQLAAPAMARPGVRRQAEANTDFRVAPDGCDGNDGLAAPKRTIGAMIAELQANWDARGFLLRIVCAPGVYEPFGMTGEIPGVVHALRIVGDTKPGACVVQGDIAGVYVDSARLLVEGFTIMAPRGIGLQATMQARVEYRDIVWGECGLSHVAAAKGGKTFAVAMRADNRTPAHQLFAGPAARHLYVNGGGLAYLTEMMRGRMEFLEPLKFEAFADVIQGGNLTAHTNAWRGPEPQGAALMVRWASVAGEALQLPGDQSLNVVDDRSVLIAGHRTSVPDSAAAP